MIKNKKPKAYRIFKRIATSNKRTSLNKLESMRPSNEQKKIKFKKVVSTISSHIDNQRDVKPEEFTLNFSKHDIYENTYKTV